MSAETARARAERLAATPFDVVASHSGGFFRGFFRSLADVVGQRELLVLLVRRELKARFKDSSLGFLWTLIRPITLLMIYFVAIGQFLGAARLIPDFAIFVFAGLTLWGLYNEIIVGGTSSIVSNAGLIKKVYLPREIFPLAASGSAIVTFLIQLGILVAAVLLLGQFPLSWNLLYVPVAIRARPREITQVDQVVKNILQFLLKLTNGDLAVIVGVHVVVRHCGLVHEGVN